MLIEVFNCLIFQASEPQNSGYVDPFTGASRYVPSTGSVADAASGVNLDPFTGETNIF